jgi:hypothetical protein
MEKNQRPACSPLHVVETDAINDDEVAGRRIVALSFFRELSI